MTIRKPKFDPALDTEMSPADLAQAIYDYALARYNDGEGWDYLVEATSAVDRIEVLTKANAATLRDAIAEYQPVMSVLAERDADARYYARGEV